MGKAVKKWQSDIEHLISGGSKKVERVQRVRQPEVREHHLDKRGDEFEQALL
jgi:hypothetical protein